MLEDNRGFNDADRTYYDGIITKIRSNESQIDSVQDLLGDPATTHIAASKDGKAVYAIVRFHGGVGSATQREGQSFVRALIDHTPKPGGLAVYQTGPAPTIGDEIAAQDHSVTRITAVSVGMIVVLLLCVYRRFSTILVPLLSVGLALAVSRPIVAFLGMHAGLDVSIFSVMLLAAIVLGAGTDYAVFLLSGYHQGRRQGKSNHEAYCDFRFPDIGHHRGLRPYSGRELRGYVGDSDRPLSNHRTAVLDRRDCRRTRRAHSRSGPSLSARTPGLR